jgi:GntR family transcriptional regulator
VVGEIRRAVAEGEAKPGERLPPARDLAAELRINRNRVLRALRRLRDEGSLEFRRGRGVTVAATPEHGAVVVQARELVRLAAKNPRLPTRRADQDHREGGVRETPSHRSPVPSRRS